MKEQFQKFQFGSIPLGLLRNLTLMTTGGIVLMALLLGFGMWRSGSRFFEVLHTMFNLSASKPEAEIRSLIIRQIRGASELTTAVFTMEAVVPAHQNRTLG
ncbi:MAG: DUF4230 domain-containing protein, partial [Coleofasciculus sp. S288]|nr:DUF4230 domain-containing protein [Coleofasciculus sp. S288]